MNGYSYILTRQIAWANNHGIALIGCKGEHARPSYVRTLDENLFQPLSPDAMKAFREGDGDEIGSPASPGKMQAVHSSSALAVNVFHYWQMISKAPTIAALCGLCRRKSSDPGGLSFENKYPINDNFRIPPNVDVIIHNHENTQIRVFAVECKFSEAYGTRGHGGLKRRYLTGCRELWDDMPNLHNLAQSISPDDKEFKNLHAAQLIKHILGLKRAFGRKGFRLLYLWYNVPGAEGERHRNEVAEFAVAARKDGILFHSLSYQELICRMAGELRSEHEAYIRYLTERYL